MRSNEADAKKEWFAGINPQTLDRPVRHLVIGHILVTLGECPPIGLRTGPRKLRRKIIETLAIGRLRTGTGKFSP